eukprot:gene17190-22965_t
MEEMQLSIAKLTSLMEKKHNGGAAMVEDDGEVSFDYDDEAHAMMVNKDTIFGNKETIFKA